MTQGKTWGRVAQGRAPRVATPSPQHTSARRWKPWILVAAAGIVLAGCGQARLTSPGKASVSTQNSTPSASPSTAAAATPVPSLSEIVWATAADPVTNAPLDDVASFASDAPRIAAFVLTGNIPPGSTIQAEWQYNDATLDAFTRQIVVPTATDRTWMSFHIDRGETETWPVGKYEVSISLDGQAVRGDSVEVVAPA